MAFTKYSGVLTGQAGSLTTALDAALATGQGWAIPLTTTNKRVYRQAGGNQFYFRVDDTGAGTGGAKEALIRGAESWLTIDTPNVNPFPSSAQSALTANSLVLRKSATADATGRPYIIYADDRTAIMFIMSESGTYYMGPWYFGDIYSLVSGDGYRTVLMARQVENSGIGASGVTPYEPFYLSNLATPGTAMAMAFGDSTAGCGGHFIARSYLGVGASSPFRHGSDFKFQGVTTPGQYMWRGFIPVPNAANGGIYLSRIHIFEYTGGQYVYRGRLRGLWAWCHLTQPYNDGDTMSGSGELAGKTFQLVTNIQNVAVDTAVIETSNTLETN